MTPCYIALGSNLGDPLEHVESAVRCLSQLPDSAFRGRSSWYRSRAVGPGEQPDYANGVVRLDTELPPRELLAHLQAIEARHGRRRGQRWGPRTLDLDIVLYGDRRVSEADLEIPHPRLAEREFVLAPLYELEPGLTLPCGTAVASLLQRCPEAGLRRYEQ